MKALARLVPLGVVLLLVVACAAATPTPAPPPKTAPAASPAPTRVPEQPKAAPTPTQSTAPATPAQSKAAPSTSAATGADRLAQMYDLAKKEGALVWNISVTDGTYDATLAAFRQKFPDIKFEAIGVGSAAAPGRILTEHGAGRLTIDVSWGSIGSLMPLIERKLLPTMDWTGLNVDKERVLLDGRAVKVHDSPWVLFYNKKLVSEGEVPRSWEDLLNPRWKGKISFSGGMTQMVALPLAWGEQRAMEFIQKLGKQEVARMPRVAASVDAVSRGEHLVGAGTLASVLEAVKDGAPLELAPVSPQVALVTVATTFAGAPHPNAASLLLAWLASSDPIKPLETGGYTSFTRPDIRNVPTGKALADKGIQLQFQDTIQKAEMSARVLPEYIKALGFTP